MRRDKFLSDNLSEDINEEGASGNEVEVRIISPHDVIDAE